MSNPYNYDDVSWAYILERCERDFLYLASNYLRFKSKHVIGFPTLKLNTVQRYLYAQMMDQWTRTGKIRKIFGKSRQVGSSTLCRAFSFHRTAFRNNINSLVVAHDEPSAMELFQIDKGFYDALPPRLKPVRRYDTKIKMEFENRNSKILVNHARNMNVGASQMNHIVHLTEVARYPNGSEVQASLFPSISEAKGEDCSVVILESTSHFGGEWFKDFAEEAMKGRNEYEFYFVPWYHHEDYRLPVPKGFEPTGEEKDLLRRFPDLTWDNLVWYRLKRAEYTANLPLFQAEFPFSWQESWILPSGTARTFSEDLIGYMEASLCPGMRSVVDSQGLMEHLAGPIEVWEPPVRGVFYDLGVDIAEGRTERSDFTAIQVLRRDTLAQVAEVRGHFDPAGQDFLDLVYWLGRAYNSGQMIPDITGGWGHALMTDLQRRNYPNIWQWRRRDDARETVSSRLGFYYTRRDKTWLVHNAVKTLQRERPRVSSSLLLSELRNFLTVGLDEWGASPGTYDDLCNAYMLALLGATDERPSVVEPLVPENRPSPPQWLSGENGALHDVDQDLDFTPACMLGSFVDRVLSSQ